MSRTLVITLIAVMLFFAVDVSAQRHRGEKRFIRGGVMEQPDTARQILQADSTLLPVIDSLQDQQQRDVDSLAMDSVMLSEMDSIIFNNQSEPKSSVLVPVDTTFRSKKRGFISDSMPLSRVCWMSTILPGFGQIYNKQYWKLPILYSTVGAGLGMFFYESSVYRPLKRQYESMIIQSSTRTPELDALQTKMIQSNTRRQLYLMTSIASYIYFIGDAAVNYSTNNVSRVKKATTLACIFPGAGQIYNKSYWKVPFVLGGFASMIYVIDWNNRGYQRFRKAYGLKADWDQSTSTDRPDQSPDEFHGRYSTSYLRTLKDSYRRNRDLCIILTAALYAIQIIDAHVEAHLKDYDISDDLSMTLEPKIDYAYIHSAGGNRPVYGFNLNFKF